MPGNARHRRDAAHCSALDFRAALPRRHAFPQAPA